MRPTDEEIAGTCLPPEQIDSVKPKSVEKVKVDPNKAKRLEWKYQPGGNRWVSKRNTDCPFLFIINNRKKDCSLRMAINSKLYKYRIKEYFYLIDVQNTPDEAKQAAQEWLNIQKANL